MSGNMSNIFANETRNEDRFKRLSVIAINTLVFERFKHFDVHGMSGSIDVFHGPNESGKTSLMEVISWMITSPPSGLTSNFFFHDDSLFECTLTFTVFNHPSIVGMLAYTEDGTLYDSRHLLDSPLRRDPMQLSDGLLFENDEGQRISRYKRETKLRRYYELFQQENVLNVEQLHEVSILEELKLSENPQSEAQNEFVVAETLELLREICPPTNVFGKIVHSVKDAQELDHALRKCGDSNRLLVNFTFRLLQLIIMNRQKQIRLPIIIDDLPQSLSDDYLHLMAKVMKKASRICQIIATTADPAVVKALDENRINIIDMDSCRPA